jgi:hypothetical protein
LRQGNRIWNRRRRLGAYLPLEGGGRHAQHVLWGSISTTIPCKIPTPNGLRPFDPPLSKGRDRARPVRRTHMRLPCRLPGEVARAEASFGGGRALSQMRIEFTSNDAGFPRRWHVKLAEHLASAGHEVALAEHPSASPDAMGAGFSLLVRLERLIYGIALPLRTEASAWPSSLSRALEERDLVVDFAGEGLAATVAAPTLIPLYDGVAGEAAAVEALLDGGSPRLAIALRCPSDSAARLVAQAFPAIEEPQILTRSLERVLAHMEGLIARTIERFRGEGLEAEGEPIPALPGTSMPGPARTALFVGRGLAAKIAARISRLCTHRAHWRIGWRHTQGDAISTRLALPDAPFSFLPDDAKRYFADPFVFWRDGVAYVFCEEFPCATGKGVISVFAIRPDGSVSEPRTVLERPYHLSYPMVFEREGRVFMIPETSANRTIELYVAAEFPHRWQLETTLLDNVSAADATLVEWDGRLWLFAAINEEGGSSWDTLGLFHAARLMGPWTPHSGNPVLIDAAAARPAGMMFERGGGLMRPAQDCTRGYGSALTLCRVDRLDPEHYRQTVLTKLAPDARWAASGMHTLNASGGIEVIDCVGGRRHWPRM